MYLREHATNVIDFEKRKMLLSTRKELKSHEDVMVCYICGKDLYKSLLHRKTIVKLETGEITIANIEA